jgi:hypothetical protein
MNNLFKFLAALVAAFTLSSAAHAGKLVGCEVRGGVLFAHDYLTADEMLASYLDNRGPRVMKNRILTGFQNCEQVLVAHGLKKATQEKKEVKVLGGRPIVPNPQKTLKDAEYCNGGEVYMFRVTFGKISDMPVGGVCKLDSRKTVTLAGH